MAAEDETKTEETKEEKKDITYEGAAAGKYSWSDGKKAVSIYIEMDGLDEVADDSFSISSGESDVTFTIAAIGGKKRTFAMKDLANEIDGSKFVRKLGKNTVVLKLTKKEEKTWYNLQSGAGGGGAGDDDDDAGGMGGMMGGMDPAMMQQMMGGMGGGMMGGGMMGM